LPFHAFHRRSAFLPPFPYPTLFRSPVLPEVGEGPSPRLQGGPPSWQGLRDLQVQPPLQGAPALKPRARERRPAPRPVNRVTRKAAAMRPFRVSGRLQSAGPLTRTLA